MPVFSLTPTWVIPGSCTSTGSSRVTMFFSGVRISAIAEYSVLVLPEPVGPVISTSPCGTASEARNASSCSVSKPSSASPGTASPRVSSRMTTFSPCRLGRVLIRASIALPSTDEPGAAVLRHPPLGDVES